MKCQDILKADFDRRYPKLHKEIQRNNVGLQSELRSARDELVHAGVDMVTGLFTRGQWFQFLNEKVKGILLPEEIENNRLSEGRESIGAENDLWIVFGDVSFLSLVNNASHEAGDALLSSIGATTDQAPCVSFGRYGGDEIVGMASLPYEAVAREIKAWERGIEHISSEFLKSKCLEPHVDIGLAGSAEAIQFMLENEVVSERGVVRLVASLLVRLADYRSAYLKCIVRLEKLATILLNDRHLYEELIGFLAKGANNPKKKDIRKLALLIKQGRQEEFRIEVSRFVLRGVESGSWRAFALKTYLDDLK